MVKSRSYIATPPEATIQEQLEDLGMNRKKFAARMDQSEEEICSLINGEVCLTLETAAKLETIFGLPAGFWNSLEAINQEKLIKAAAENAGDSPYPLQQAA